MTIIENYHGVKERAAAAAVKSGRDPESVQIIAVSKTFPAPIVQEAIDQGILLLGENKVQEAKTKIPLLTGDGVFHMIGHLQSNKAKEAVQLFDLIHSIDKQSTADKINREAEKIDKIQKILIQVNTSGETAKSGVAPDQLTDLVREVLTLKNIRLEGFMAMAPFTTDDESVRHAFSETRRLLAETNETFGISLKELSMGMSGDFETAIEEGATLIRVGSLIFGERTYT